MAVPEVSLTVIPALPTACRGRLRQESIGFRCLGRNLWRRRRRTLITISSIAFGTFLAVIFTAFQDRNFADMIDLAARMIGGQTLDPKVESGLIQDIQQDIFNDLLSGALGGTNPKASRSLP